MSTEPSSQPQTSPQTEEARPQRPVGESLSVPFEFECPTCKVSFQAEVPLVVAYPEHTTLARRLREGNLHIVTCPKGHRFEADFPRLLYQLGDHPTLMLVPTRRAANLQDYEMIHSLMSLLEKRLGSDWNEDWVNGYKFVELDLLYMILRVFPDADLYEVAALAEGSRAEQNEPVRRSDPDSQRVRFTGPSGGTDADADIPIPLKFEGEIERIRQAQARFLQSGQMREVEEAIAIWDQVFSSPAFSGTDKRFQIWAMDERAKRCLHYYTSTAQPELLDQAVALWQAAVSEMSQDAPKLPTVLHNLGTAFLIKYEVSHQISDLDGAIQSFQRGSSLSSRNSLTTLASLGDAFYKRYKAAHSRVDLDAAVRSIEEAVSQTPQDAPERSTYSAILGQYLLDRYGDNKISTDLERAIEYLEQAIAHPSAGGEDYYRALGILGTCLKLRYTKTRQLPDLERSIQYLREDIEHIPSDAPALLLLLGDSLLERYNRQGQAADLDESARCLEEALRLPQLDKANRVASLYQLGRTLEKRYHLAGRLADLEQAIRCFEQSVETAPADDTDLPSYHSSLGAAYMARYDRTRKVEDLELAQREHDTAFTLTTGSGHPAPMVLNNRAIYLAERYQRTDDLDDLQRAIQAFKETFRETPADSERQYSVRYNLGKMLYIAYHRTYEPDDLEQAIQYFSEANEGSVPGTAEHPSRLGSLANALQLRYDTTGETADLNRAITYLEQATELAVPYSPNSSRMLRNLGSSLESRYRDSGTLADLKRSLEAREKAWFILQTTFASVNLDFKLGQQEEWHSFAAELVEAYLLSAEVNPSQADLALRRALAVVEGSKSRLLTEMVGRHDIPVPPSIPAELADRERDLLGLLTAPELRLDGEDSLNVEKRQRQRQELEALWDRMAAAGPDAGEYVALRRGDPPTWDDLARLAHSQGPDSALLSLMITNNRTCLFILRAGWQKPVIIKRGLGSSAWPEILLGLDVEIQSRGSRTGIEPWPEYLKPLFTQASTHLKDVKRVILAPVAGGHLIPWSVLAWQAGWQTPDGNPMPIVTVPALGILTPLMKRNTSRENNILVVGNPLGDLQYAGYEAQVIAEKLNTTALIGDKAHKTEVLERMTRARISHLATHAQFASEKEKSSDGWPLESGFYLKDGKVSVREILGHRFSSDLLVLSACQTGIARSLGGEELVGLMQGFLQAGARCLIVSLWNVDDVSTALLMREFYRQFLEEKQDIANALSRAQAWLRSATAEQLGLAEIWRRIYEDSGQTDNKAYRFFRYHRSHPADRPFEHPYYWAPFIACGIF